MTAIAPSTHILNQRLQNVLYELNQIKGAMTNMVKPRGKYRQKLLQAFQGDLRALSRIVAIGQEKGLRLDTGYRQIKNLMAYYEQQGKVWFQPTTNKKDAPKSKPQPYFS